MKLNWTMTTAIWAFFCLLNLGATGYAIVQGQGFPVVAMFVVSLFSLMVMRAKVTDIQIENVSVWMVVTVFVLFYFARYPLLSENPLPAIATHPNSISNLFRDGGVGLKDALYASTFSFFVFSMFFALFYVVFRSNEKENKYSSCSRSEHISVQILLITTPLLMLLLAAVAYNYKIGQMGVDPGEPLPFRLKGLIFYSRLVVLPLMILAIINFGCRLDRRDFICIGIILLAMHGISDVFIRVSRSSMLLCILLLVFLVVSGGLRLKRLFVIATVVVVILSIISMPLVIEVRRILIHEDGTSIFNTLYKVLFLRDNNFVDLFLTGVSTLYFRIPGIETMWAISNSNFPPLWEELQTVLVSPHGMAGYLTFTLYRIAPVEYVLFAPGFVGWWYLAGGYVGIAIGAVVLACVCVVLPRYFSRMATGNGPLFNTFFLWVLFLCLTDGALDSNFLLVAVGTVFLVVGNFIFARLLNLNRQKRD